MTGFPDTSFLCALYVRQDNSSEAAAYFGQMKSPMSVSGLVLYEFRQSVRFQVWLYGNNPAKGYSKQSADVALTRLQSDLDSGALKIATPDWAAVHHAAEIISQRYTITGGHRAFDILHVATAVCLGAVEFLTFDARQKRLAAAENLTVKP
jgi:predicted nucleic acid-binding protein